MNVDMGDTSPQSSDSEIETSIKFKVQESVKKLCVFCLKTGDLIECTPKTFETFVSSLERREAITKKKRNVDLFSKVALVKTGGHIKDLLWHRKCYSSFTSKQNIKNLEKKMLKYEEQTTREDVLNTTELGVSLGVSLRKTNYIVDRCVFCQKTSKTKKLSQVMTISAQKKIQLIAYKNPIIFERIGANDLIAMEVKYHFYSKFFLLKKWEETLRKVTFLIMN